MVAQQPGARAIVQPGTAVGNGSISSPSGLIGAMPISIEGLRGPEHQAPETDLRIHWRLQSVPGRQLAKWRDKEDSGGRRGLFLSHRLLPAGSSDDLCLISSYLTAPDFPFP